MRARVDLADLRMNDGVKGEQESAHGSMRLEELRVLSSQKREGVATKPSDNRVGRKVELDRNGRHQLHQFFVVVIPERGINAVELRGLEHTVPHVLAVFLSNYFFEQIENDSLHSLAIALRIR